ncbi:hypothetical protein [Nitrosomonas communis]|nr:hypothetical protein [Nitrosomonas communis]
MLRKEDVGSWEGKERWVGIVLSALHERFGAKSRHQPGLQALTASA